MRFLFLLFVISNLAFTLENVTFKNLCVPLKYFSDKQKEVLLKSYIFAQKEGFGYTLAAIAWKESCAGEYKMNFQDPSAGNYHAYIPGVIKRYPQLRQNGFTENMVGAKLVDDDEFAIKVALNELDFWKKTHKGDWKKIIKSYNKGYSWQKDSKANAQAEKYYADVASKVRELQEYFRGKDLHKIALNLPKENHQKNTKREEKEFYLLPIYQVGNEFIGTNSKKPTILKEFELMKIY